MANTQINISANGTATLVTAGKYCDRNIDVNVNVKAKPTQFTNYYVPKNVVIDKNISGSGGFTETSDTECNYIKIPYHHKANEPVELRIRGIGTVRSRFAFVLAGANGTDIVLQGQLSGYFNLSHDEFGDALLTASNSVASREWYYLYINFQYIGTNAITTPLTGPIITINEPIGNGGYVE